jgi:hypothetical protein
VLHRHDSGDDPRRFAFALQGCCRAAQGRCRPQAKGLAAGATCAGCSASTSIRTAVRCSVCIPLSQSLLHGWGILRHQLHKRGRYQSWHPRAEAAAGRTGRQNGCMQLAVPPQRSPPSPPPCRSPLLAGKPWGQLRQLQLSMQCFHERWGSKGRQNGAPIEQGSELSTSQLHWASCFSHDHDKQSSDHSNGRRLALTPQGQPTTCPRLPRALAADRSDLMTFDTCE